MAEYKTGSQVNYGWGLSLNMTGKAPAVAKRIWGTLADAQAYVDDANESAIAGLQLTVVNDPDPSKNGVYFVQAAAGEDDHTKGVLVKQAADSDASGALTAAKKYTDDVKAELLGVKGETGNTIISAKEDAAAAKTAADNASEKVDTAIGDLNSTVHNGTTATSAGTAASAQIKVTVEESKGKLTGVTVNAPSFESAGAADNVKTELLGVKGETGNTIISAKEDAAAAKTAADNASKKVDAEIEKLDVTGNTSDAVKGVTVTVNETDGKVTQPVISIADGTLTGVATDGNLVTGSTVKTYVDGKVKTITDNANALSGRVDKLDATHTKKGDGSFNTVAEEVTTGIAGIAETSKANTAGSDVVVTVTTKSGSVSSVAVDSSVLNKAVTDGDDAVKTELRGDAATDYNTLGKLEDKIQEETSRADAAEKVNAGAISAEADRAKKAEKANADAIAKINGTGDGSFAKGDADTLASAKSYADEKIKTSVSSVYKVKGTKATYADLPSEGNVEGDVWNVTAAHGNTPAGTNYVWVADGETGHWDPLGGTIDLSPYAKSADVATTYATKTELSTTKSDLIGDATADYDTLGKLETKIKANTDSITMITGTGDGSITKAVGDAKSALIGTDGDAATKDTIYGAKQAVKDLEAQIEKDAVTLTIPDTDPYITASKDATTNKYTISSKLDTDGKTPLVDAKINTKLTEKINSLSGGGIAGANGISIKVTEEKGIIGIPEVSVIPGDVNKDDNHVVTGGAVYTALTNALTWNDIPATA